MTSSLQLSDREILDFERPIVELERKIEELRALDSGSDLDSGLRDLEEKARQLREEIFSELSPHQKVQLSRHPCRPYTLDYVAAFCEDFLELHGDRTYADDRAIVAGMARFEGTEVLVIGHQKGRNTKENVIRNFGMPRPEGYRKGTRVMRLAARFGRPILCFIDTPGAYPGIGAEERGQSEAIAKSLQVMSSLEVPIIAVVVGEGGSGGALAIGVADAILMLEHSVYSVISPEGCASILWRDPGKVQVAAEQLKLTAQDLKRLGICDEVIAEPLGGAHRDPEASALSLSAAIKRHLDPLMKLPPSELVERRYQKFRSMGAFTEQV